MSKALGRNPLLATKEEERPVLTEKDIATIKAANSDADQYTTMSFKVRKTHLNKLRKYAYTYRMEIKEVLDEALALYLSRVDESELLELPEKKGFRRVYK